MRPPLNHEGPSKQVAPATPQVGPALALLPTPHLPPQRQPRALASDEAVRFSWVQSAMTLFSYVWLLSNFARTEFALTDLDAHVTIEPDEYISFGPYAYVGNAFFRNDVGGGRGLVSSPRPVALWGYKFDTTSIAMRAYAEHLQVTAFPDCVLYRGACEDDFLPPALAMTMLDALVDAVRNATAAAHTPTASTLVPTQAPAFLRYRPRSLVLRVGYEYFDRIHHYLFPQVFANPFWRACQAVYYSPELLAIASERTDSMQPPENTTFADLCSLAYDEVRPFFCDERWTNFRHSCARSNKKCRAVGRVSQHAVRRLSALRTAYPNATVDLLVIESVKDIAIQRGGVTFVGKGGTDIVTLFRVRTCAADGSCETQMLDDYRYEGETIISDVVKWTAVVTALRGAAQTYYWIRVFMLFCGCYFAAAAQVGASSSTRTTPSTLRRTCSMFFKIPNQCVVYGSSFPLICYLLAHVIDSPIVYEIMAQKFESFNGLFKMSLAQLITFSSIQMRNVWLLGNAAHLSVRFATQANWSPLDGVWGVPQFSIALVSSLTIISQFRFLSLRKTSVKTILPLEVMSPIHPVMDTLLYVNGGGGKSGLGGIFLDFKAMACSIVVLAVVGTVVTLLLRVACTRSRVKLVFWRSYSATPLSAGVIWPTTALAVSWSDDLFHIDKLDIAAWRQVQNLRATHAKARATSVKPLCAGHPPIEQFGQQIHQTPEQLPSRPMEISTLDERSAAVESAMYLMNVAMLSDPMAYTFWRWSMSKTPVGYFRSLATQRVYLVPLVHTTAHACGLDWSELTLERTAFADELPWSEIITCG